MNKALRSVLCGVGIGGLLVACAQQSQQKEPLQKSSDAVKPAPVASAPSPVTPTKTVPVRFKPPKESDIPDNEFGEAVRLGKNIFINTQQYAKDYVGNGLNCVNCHLDNGRRAHSAPIWAAYVIYPAYRAKTGRIDTIQSRIQGCFTYSMNGKPPAWDSKEMTALVTYHYWLATGAPNAVKMPGQGFVKLANPALTPDLERGKQVFENNCAFCHGADGMGRKVKGAYTFPPLWGKDSFNWGAGMHRVDTAASFVKANMPYGAGGTLSDQEAWDVALYMNSKDRPVDPRYKESLAQTREKFHDENCLYGRTPQQLAALLAAKKTATPSKPKTAPSGDAVWKGDSPATAHEMVPAVGR